VVTMRREHKEPTGVVAMWVAAAALLAGTCGNGSSASVTGHRGPSVTACGAPTGIGSATTAEAGDVTNVRVKCLNSTGMVEKIAMDVKARSLMLFLAVARGARFTGL